MSNLVREKLESYFASLNSTSNRMMADIKSSREEYGDKWNSLEDEQQSDILWQAIVKPDILQKYNHMPCESVDIESFPILRTKPGAKIIIEEDTTVGRPFGCAWRDEHSAPFRWETQSQLELRIFDIDEDDKKPRSKSCSASREVIKVPDEVEIDFKKEEEIKKPSILKRPEVPPPPIPPHATVQVPMHDEIPAVPLHVEKSDAPICAKVVKRKSSAKTLLISELKAHRRAKEEMKPAVPPRMSLELKNLDLTQFGDPTDVDGIPKTGFDFLDNW